MGEHELAALAANTEGAPTGLVAPDAMEQLVATLTELVAAAVGEVTRDELEPLVTALAEVAAEISGPMTLDAMERLVTVRVQQILQGVAQLALIRSAAAQVKLPVISDTSAW